MNRFRPQVALALAILGLTIAGGIYYGMTELASMGVGGLIALARDVINKNDRGDP